MVKPLEDLTDNYTVTPLDRLFRFAMEKLEIPFLHAEAVLHRRYQNLPLPFELGFIAQNEEKSKIVRYSRILSLHPVFFDHLDKLDGNRITLDELISTIRERVPLGGKVQIKVKDLSLALNSGFNYGKYLANDALSYGDGHCYNNSDQKLTVELNIPWLNKHLYGSRIERDLKEKSLDESVLTVRDILVDYLETLK